MSFYNSGDYVAEMLIQTSSPTLVRRNPTPKAKPEPEGKVEEFVRENPLLATGLLGSAAYTAASAFPATWLHEQGHAQAIKALYTNGRPSVEVFPFKGGVTRWYPSQLTQLGQKLGADNARAMVAAAGTIVDIGVATGTFALGFNLRKEHPIAGSALMGYGAMTMLNSVLYAGSALGKNLAQLSTTGNDFATIAVKGGLPPIASVAILASIIPLEYLALRWLEKRGESPEVREFAPRGLFPSGHPGLN